MAIVQGSTSTYFDEQFTIKRIDDHGFDRVHRIRAVCDSYPTTQLRVDINTEIYPMRPNERFHMVLTTTLDISKNADSDPVYDPALHERRTILDAFDYAMHGRIYKIQPWKKKDRDSERPEKDIPRLAISASFGGLLMYLKGQQTNHHLLQNLRVDMAIYLLIKKYN